MDTEKRPPSIDGKLKKEFLKFENEKESRTLKDTLKDLGETSSLHGISKIASSRQVVVKVLWCILFLGTFAVFMIQLVALFKTFYSYPIQTTVSLDFNSIAFPAITLCNMNPVKNGMLHMVPALQEVINKGQNPSMLLRKRREATKKQKSKGQHVQFPSTPSTGTDKEEAKAFTRDQSSLPLNSKENKLEQIRFRENLFHTERGLRRRKREASIAPSGTLSSDSTLLTSLDPTQTAATPSMSHSVSVDSSQSLVQESVLSSSDFSQLPQLFPSSDSVSHFPTSTHSMIYTESITPERTSTEDFYIPPATPTVSLTDFMFENTTGIFNFNTNGLSSSIMTQSESSIPWPWMHPDYLQSSSSSPYPSTYPDDSNTWEAWYNYYSYDYLPFFYDSYLNYDSYWYDWYNYNSWYDYSFGGSFFFDQLHSKKDEWDERVQNFRTVFKNESIEQRKEIGHQKEDMIVSASFAGRVQNITHFQNFTSTEYGNCYTMASPKYVAWRSGPTHGVKLTLNLEIDEYIPNFSTGYGIRIVFHEPGTHPLPSHEGITLSPGTETNIGLRMSCYEFCRIHQTIQDCNCIPVEAPDGINMNSTTLPVCNSSVKAVKACLLEVDVRFDNGDYSCDCRGPCNETAYAKTTSSTYWPTDDYLEVLLSELCETHQTAYWISLCSTFEYMPYWELDRFRYNFLRVLVYFEDLNYETITEEPMYESVRFLSDIGGAMGLFLGASVLSFVEVVQLLLELFLYMKGRHDNKTTPVSHFSAN